MQGAAAMSGRLQCGPLVRLSTGIGVLETTVNEAVSCKL